jgi:hypothetical protein
VKGQKMLNKMVSGAAMLMALTASSTCFAQSDTAKPVAVEQAKYYHLDFVIKELEGGKVINSRHYSMMVLSQTNGSIRTGDKVPVGYASGDGKYTYLDVGVNIDCRQVRQVQDKLVLSVAVDISSVAGENTSVIPPLIRNTKWSSEVTLPLNKPTVLFMSDDATAKRQMQLELTGTPVI